MQAGAQGRLRIAIQKSGRLAKECQALLTQCGIRVHYSEHKLIAYAKNMPIEILRVRDDDIAGLVFDGVVDLGIVGGNVLEESTLDRHAQGQGADHLHLRTLDFGGCHLSIAIPKEVSYQGISSLEGARIATSYPHILRRYMQTKGVCYQSCFLAGSVEVAPSAGIANAICDLVSSGATLEANGLKEVEVIYKSSACLIQKSIPLAPHKAALVDTLLTRIEGVCSAQESKYIMMHAPKNALDDIIALMPGVENPTVLTLAQDQNRVAVHAVSQEGLFWETMEALKAKGASSILVLPIEKMLN